MRKLATIRVANTISPIEGADAIEAVRVDGWTCVSKKGEFKVGDKGVYFEIDSFLNGDDERFQFLFKQFITFKGKKGARLRTMRIRGQLSNGLFLPLEKFPELKELEVGTDVTESLGVIKWEPPISAQLAGEVRGIFPHFIKKTDEERCVAGDTVVETDDVIQPFKTIQEIVETRFSGKVKSFNHEMGQIEFRSVIGWSEIPNEHNWLEITLKSGKKMYVTRNHKIWSETRKEYFNAETFQEGEKVIIN